MASWPSSADPWIRKLEFSQLLPAHFASYSPSPPGNALHPLPPAGTPHSLSQPLTEHCCFHLSWFSGSFARCPELGPHTPLHPLAGIFYLTSLPCSLAAAVNSQAQAWPPPPLERMPQCLGLACGTQVITLCPARPSPAFTHILQLSGILKGPRGVTVLQTLAAASSPPLPTSPDPRGQHHPSVTFIPPVRRSPRVC